MLYSYIVLCFLMIVQTSSLLNKFLIGACYNYEGSHPGDPKYDIKIAIPGFTYLKYTQITGFYYSAVYGFSSLISGKISDAVPRKPLLVLMIILWNTTSLVSSFANSFALLASMRMMYGLFGAFSSPICYSLIADYFPPDKRTFANAMFTSASFLGIALSSLCNDLINVVGWRNTYLYVAFYGYAAAICVLVAVKDPERGRYDPNKQKVLEEEEKMIEEELA
jgi:MFS family permease